MEEELRKHMMNNSKTSDYQNQIKTKNILLSYFYYKFGFK